MTQTLAPPVKRPVLRYFGGKWMLAPWVISHLPSHRVYVEPFGGAASVLLRKPRSYAEIYNDLDGQVVQLFKVLRDPVAADELKNALRLTPFARQEFEAAYTPESNPVEQCRCLIIRALMGFGADGIRLDRTTGFRANSNRSGTTPAHDWVTYADGLDAVTQRLRGVVIENRDALDVMRQHDGPQTLHYVDPPYLPATRSQKTKSGDLYHGYVHDMATEDHLPLLDGLKDLEGRVVLSGYPSDLYDAALQGWRRIDRDALADGARPRIECLWINAAAARALEADQADATSQGVLL